MNQYFKVAEIVYENIFEQKEVSTSQDPVITLNKIMSEIVNHATRENLKLKYKTIDFVACLNVPISERTIKIDLSLFPMLKTRDEMIPWIAQFIKAISINKWSIKSGVLI